MIIRTMNAIDDDKTLNPSIRAWGHSTGTLWSFNVETDTFGNEVSFTFNTHDQLVAFLSKIGNSYVKALQHIEDERMRFLSDKGMEKIMEEAYGGEK